MIVPPKRQDAAAARPLWRRRGWWVLGGQYATVRLLISHHIRSGLSPPSTGSKSGLTGNTRGEGRETRKRGGTHRGRAGGNRGEKRRLCLWSVHIIFEDIRKKRKKPRLSCLAGAGGTPNASARMGDAAAEQR